MRNLLSETASPDRTTILRFACSQLQSPQALAPPWAGLAGALRDDEGRLVEGRWRGSVLADGGQRNEKPRRQGPNCGDRPVFPFLKEPSTLLGGLRLGFARRLRWAGCYVKGERRACHRNSSTLLQELR